MRRNINSGMYIVLNVSPREENEAKIRGARNKDGFLCVKKDHYNLAAFESWLPIRYDLNELLKHIKEPPVNRIREIVSTPFVA